MKILLDTHAFLWWIMSDSRLSKRASDLIAENDNELFFSAVSAWEIAIKARLGRIQLPKKPEHFLLEQLRINSILPLAVQISHALHVYNLPDYHQDPFDRLLISQAIMENLTILTADELIGRYKVKTVW